MSEYTIDRLTADRFELLIPLMKDAFGGDEHIDYFNWKYLRNPAGEFVGFIAVDRESGEVGAYYGVIPQKYIIDGKPETIYQSCDTMTHSRHRRRGLFQKLAAHCYEYLRNEGKLFIIGFGGDQSTPGFLKFGWRQPFAIGYQFYPRILASLPFRVDRSVQEITDVRTLASAALKSNFSARIRSDKSADVISWRLANPRHPYSAVGVNTAGTVSSYAVYYVEDSKLILFDFFFNTRGEGSAVVTYLKQRMKDQKLRGIVCFSQVNSGYSQALSQHGFLTNPFRKGPLSAKVPFIFYSTNDRMDSFMNPSAWAINAFDHDAL